MDDFEVHIRHAREADLPALEWGGEYRRYRRVYQRAMREANLGQRILYIAEIGSEIVGQIFVQLSCNSTRLEDQSLTGYLQSFRIKPAYRNRGIGTRLIHQAEKALRERGFQRVVIAVAKENHSARRLYERLGYTVFDEDFGQWSYIDDKGQVRRVSEPSYLLEKQLW